MSVLEYAEDMNKKVEEVLKMCESLGHHSIFPYFRQCR